MCVCVGNLHEFDLDARCVLIVRSVDVCVDQSLDVCELLLPMSDLCCAVAGGVAVGGFFDSEWRMSVDKLLVVSDRWRTDR